MRWKTSVGAFSTEPFGQSGFQSERPRLLDTRRTVRKTARQAKEMKRGWEREVVGDAGDDERINPI